jgi:glycine dehydrogenase subunit 2
MKQMIQLIFEESQPGRQGVTLPCSDVPSAEPLPDNMLRTQQAGLPEVSELECVRHFTNLYKLNFSVDTHFYPLGSCTMKYNPRILEDIAQFPGFTRLHPFLSEISSATPLTQGALQMLFELQELLAEITGMHAFTSQPMAGAHGELTGILLIAQYHRVKGNNKKYILVPDSSHGTNPASAAVAGYEVITIPSLPNGELDIEKLNEQLNDEVAAIMLTCPNTLGLFETRIKEIASLAHQHDALLYYDGANLNAILGKVRPGDIGFDVVHVNVHKTFGTPHGGGGPGAGPVGVTKKLTGFLPISRITKDNNASYNIHQEAPESIGKMAPFFGNFSVLLKSYAYLLLLGKEGLIDVSEKAVLNANYIMQQLKKYYYLPYDRNCMHECVFSTTKAQTDKSIHALDIAKYLIDQDIHPPTIYFPLIVKEAMMIEPTETENKETLDNFINAMIAAAQSAQQNPDMMHQLPKTTPITRPDETKAARELQVIWEKEKYGA